MRSIRLRLKSNPYNIVIGNNILSALGAKLKSLNIGRDAVIVTNPAVNKFHGRALITGLKKSGFSVKVIEVPAGERSKSAKAAARLMEDIACYDGLKQIFIIAFGGGVIGDLAGYVAAVYKRGVPYVQVPTTLLAQVDSAIGGKVAIDLSMGKNLVGAFYQPRIVWSDVAVLSTLTRRQIRNGLAEVVKYGIIGDPAFFKYVAGNVNKLLALDLQTLSAVVRTSSRIKADVVAADERDTRGIRAALNFGHTLGHAIEAAGKYNQYHHGEAIALGMRLAAHISYQKRLCTASALTSVNHVLSQLQLPDRIQRVKTVDILRSMKHDKKFLSGRNRFVLMKRIGKVGLVQGISLGVIKKAINTYR